MLNANLILIFFVVLILLKNHFIKNKGVVYIILALLCLFNKILAESFNISDLQQSFLFNFFLLDEFFSFLALPFLWLYLDTVFKKPLLAKRYLFILFLPFLVVAINFIPFYSLASSDKIQIIQDSNSSLAQKIYLGFSWKAMKKINVIYNTLLGIGTLISIFYNLERSKQSLSRKSYFLILQLGFLCFIAFAIINTVKGYTYFYPSEINKPEWLGILAMAVPLSILLFPNFVYDNPNNSDLNFYLRMMNRFSKQEVATINNELVAETSRIVHFLNVEKPYLAPGFSIHDVVKHLDLPQKTVTDCFNKVIKVPFPKMRNQLRVDFAIEMFRNNSHLQKSISGIATESGFKNRATFYVAFKESTKMTPIDWIKQNCEFQLIEDLPDESLDLNKNLNEQEED
jgi:AraC-like DNA-binding protein